MVADPAETALRGHPDTHGSAVERGAAAVRLGDRAHDREAEAAAPARPCPVAAGEALERALGDVGREAAPAVGHLEANAAVVGPRPQHDVALAVAQGVVYEVAERLPQAHGVRLDGHVAVGDLDGA